MIVRAEESNLGGCPWWEPHAASQLDPSYHILKDFKCENYVSWGRDYSEAEEAREQTDEN